MIIDASLVIDAVANFGRRGQAAQAVLADLPAAEHLRRQPVLARTREPTIAGMPGFGRLTLSRCLERPGTYLLLAVWAFLEDYTVGFRGSTEYQEWRELLHHLDEPFPLVEHDEHVLQQEPC